LDFLLKLNFYGPVNKQGVIKKVLTNTFNDLTSAQMQKITVETDPATANVTDNYGYISNFEDF
jgi:uncharacterized protein YfaP (DUF2135 family)